MDDHKLVFAGQVDDALEQRQAAQGAGRVVRVVENQQFGPWIDIGAHGVDAFQKSGLLFQGDANHAAAGDDGGIDVHGKGRSRDQDRISRTQQGQGQVGDALF